MAIYPVLFTLSLRWFFPGLTTVQEWVASLGMIWMATLINLRGAGRVGLASVVVGSFVLAGFGLLVLFAVPKMNHLPWVPFLKPGTSATGAIGVGLSLALWNFIGWDNASTVGGEIENAERTYPKALAITVPLVAGVYLVTLLTTLSASDWTTWQAEGGWPAIARTLAGPFGAVLAPWLALAGMASAFALFNAYLLTYSRIPLVVATDGLLPAALARTDERGTPRGAVLMSAVLYSCFALLPLGGLVVADVLLYAMALGLEFAALVALRVREPTLRGSFRVPLGTAGVAVLACLPMATIIGIAGLSMRDGELGLPAVVGAGTAVVLGPLLYRWRRATSPASLPSAGPER
jgi:amino acid transporter